MSLVDFLILGLATWRMASLLAREAGPFDVFLRIRKLSGITHDDEKNVVMVPERFFAQMISCVWCNGLYIATFWTLCRLLTPFAIWFASPFALGALAIWVDSRASRD